MNQFLIPSQINKGEKQKSFAPITRLHFQSMLLVMLLTLVYVLYETKFSTPNLETLSPVSQQVSLIINDAQNGDILLTVTNTSSSSQTENNNQILTFSGEQGFLRGTLRALARERRMRNLTSEAPFELALHQDGRLTITDTLTGKGIDLEAFGPDNVAVFANILTQSVGKPSLNH